MKLNVIGCNVFRREMYAAAARSTNTIDLQFLCQGLHDIPATKMRDRVQAAIDGVTDPYDAICLGYGLCNNGLVGVTARSCPLVIPRAHDCITMFLGSGEKYLNFFEKYPGTYFKTTGWIERSENPEELSQLSISRQSGMESTYEELVEKYGEDNAKFLYETLVQNTHHYSKLAFISMGVEPDDRFEKIVREDAVGRKWKFEKITGDMRLIQHLMDGEWNEDEFLVVPEGRSIVATHDDSIVGDRGE